MNKGRITLLNPKKKETKFHHIVVSSEVMDYNFCHNQFVHMTNCEWWNCRPTTFTSPLTAYHVS